ncbi:MAG: hypothetical protein JWN35_2604 [Frankiales bacterium]|jgi:hypothetical protein|nr:hypothetical protein [Frankiales bacterium]
MRKTAFPHPAVMRETVTTTVRIFPHLSYGGWSMAAMKPRTGDGPLEVTKEGRGIVMRVPLEGGGRLVVELNAEEVNNLADALKAVLS